jgi:CheY-like chemotaxis protein
LPRTDGGAAAPSLEGVRVAFVSRSGVLSQALRATLVSLSATVVDQSDQPDVILYDWPRAPDAEEIAALKNSARAVIALIAQEDRAAIALCRDAGLPHYTLKPLRRRSLVERVKIALGGEGADWAEDADTDVEAPRLDGLRVLLAEDNPINALLARTLLARAGCSVVVAHDGEDAVAAAAAATYDLILLDIRMPRLDGFEAAQRIRAGKGPSASAPIVALTADAGDEERARARQAGMDDFLTKPLDAARLIAVAGRFTQRPNAATVAG